MAKNSRLPAAVESAIMQAKGRVMNIYLSGADAWIRGALEDMAKAENRSLSHIAVDAFKMLLDSRKVPLKSSSSRVKK